MGLLIRVYDYEGRLLYIAGTTAEHPGTRLRLLRSQMKHWWAFADQTKTSIDEVDDPKAALPAAIKREHPKYYTDLLGKQPYARRRPAPSDYARHLMNRSAVARVARDQVAAAPADH